MANLDIKESYSTKLSDKEILEEISKLQGYSNGDWKPEIIVAANAIIQSGQAELNSRFTKRSFWMMCVLILVSLFLNIFPL